MLQEYLLLKYLILQILDNHIYYKINYLTMELITHTIQFLMEEIVDLKAEVQALKDAA